MTTDEGQSAYEIVTQTATFYFQDEAGGFSSLVDPDGNDWISFNRNSGSAGMYRGIPNLVHPGDIFHPGHAHCATTVEREGADRITLRANSTDGKWETVWDFYQTHATLTVTKDDRDYWFLYEGTPGGRLDTDSDTWLIADGTQKTVSNGYNADLPEPEWIAFGDASLSRVLFLVHHEDDGDDDRFYQMQNNMTVFGFGRNGLAKSLRGVHTFSIGFVESDRYADIQNTVEAVMAQSPPYEPVTVLVPNGEEHYPNAGGLRVEALRWIDPSGRAVVPPAEVTPAGLRRDFGGVASGVYLPRRRVGGAVFQKRMAVIR